MVDEDARINDPPRNVVVLAVDDNLPTTLFRRRDRARMSWETNDTAA